MTNRSWFTARAIDADEAEIAIYDEIGLFGITAKDFRDELKALGPVEHINLRINSPGGDVFDGLAIHNMLARHKASITVTVDGVAASMASVIAMAGDAVVMPENAMMMIHDPSGIVVGTSRDMRELADVLDKLKSSLVSAYANKSGMSRDEITTIMADETWLTAEEAVEFGFADSIEAPVKMAASFDLSKFKNAPEALMPERSRGPATTRQTQETDMTDTPENGAAEVSAAVTENEIIFNDRDGNAKKLAESAATLADDSAEQDEPVTPVSKRIVPETETPDQIMARARTEERKRNADIVALCQKAGLAAKASEFIASDKSAGEVAIAILSERAAASPEITARNSGAAPAATLDTNQVWDHWNAPKH